MTDIVTRLDIENVRCLSKVVLDLKGVNVLIGENGSGKITLVECCELLRRIPGGNFFDALYQNHSGPSGLLRQGAKSLDLCIRVEDSSGVLPGLVYNVCLFALGATFQIEHEQLLEQSKVPGENGESPYLPVFNGTDGDYGIAEPSGTINHFHGFSSKKFALDAFSLHYPSVGRMCRALERIDVQVPFDTRPNWLIRGLNLPSGMMLQPTNSLARQGSNLPSVYHILRDRADWR